MFLKFSWCKTLPTFLSISATQYRWVGTPFLKFGQEYFRYESSIIRDLKSVAYITPAIAGPAYGADSPSPDERPTTSPATDGAAFISRWACLYFPDF